MQLKVAKMLLKIVKKLQVIDCQSNNFATISGKNMDWGEIIRRIREDKGLSQQNLADEVGVDKTTIIRWEKEGKVKTEHLQTIAKALKVELSELYAYHTNPTLLNDPLSYYKRKTKVSVLVELDGSLSTLDEWFATLKKLNAAI